MFDDSQVKALESYTQSAQQGQKFASAGGLKGVKLEYLPVPASASPSSQSGSPVPGGAK
jgi:hypothetical protein